MNRNAAFSFHFLALVICSSAAAQDPKPSEAVLIEQPKADYASRRASLMEKVAKAEARRADGPGAVVVLRGGDPSGREDFEEGRFRQENNFAYLTGVDFPGAWLVMLPKEGRSTLYLPPKSGPSVMNGESPRPGPGEEAARSLGFETVAPTSRLYADIFTAIGDPTLHQGAPTSGTAVYLLVPTPRQGDDRPDARLARFLREGAPSSRFRDLKPLLGEMRKIKTPAELAILQKAIDITGEANNAVMRTIRPGLREFQLEAVIHAAFTDGGALRAGFASIVGSGPNGTIPHYFLNTRTMLDGELVVVDIGAEYKLYTADVTRTYPVSGVFTPRQKEIYRLVLDAQSAAEQHIKPNVTTLGEMTGFVRDYFRKSPLRAKDENGVEHTMDHFFIHGLSHYLGMDVHDVGDITTPMKPGEVLTIEPGLYIKSENIGIRIEDDYLITETGLKKLTGAIPSKPDEIEAGIAQARSGSHPKTN